MTNFYEIHRMTGDKASGYEAFLKGVKFNDAFSLDHQKGWMAAKQDGQIFGEMKGAK